jgi:hypothetical protein
MLLTILDNQLDEGVRATWEKSPGRVSGSDEQEIAQRWENSKITLQGHVAVKKEFFERGEVLSIKRNPRDSTTPYFQMQSTKVRPDTSCGQQRETAFPTKHLHSRYRFV